MREAVGLVDRARDGEPGVLDPDLVLRAVATRVVALDEAPADGELGFEELLAVPARDVPPLPDPEKLAALLYTSGTSGRPRAAMLTHRALLANVEQVAVVEPPMMRGDDVVLGVLPMFHVYGLNAVLGGVARHGCRLVVAERFEPEATLDLVAAEGCHRRPARAAGLRLLARPARPARAARLGPVDPVRLRAAGQRRSSRSSARRPASRSTRATD